MNPPDAGWMPWLDKIGWPLAIMIGCAMVIFVVVRALWAWGRPHLDRWIEAQVKSKEAEASRHAAISDAMTKLVDKTLEIQESTKQTVDQLKEKVPEVCKWRERKNA